jgi:hypothetical protein
MDPRSLSHCQIHVYRPVINFWTKLSLTKPCMTGVAVYYMSSLWQYEVTSQLTLDGDAPLLINLTSTVGGTDIVKSSVVWGVNQLLNTQHTLTVSMAPNGQFVECDGFMYVLHLLPRLCL